ncbi:transposase [Metallosphaera yellowstonensis MK1]|uniref:Transposase n=1 Tax=Metallosphaera yellowstonensis MK1 TaxID=671065 RepID=H2C4B6_9CREN|nr:transposase [Metallosphaera yellowstonensis MK1]
MIVDGKYVKLRGGRKGVLPIALGLTEDGVRAVLDVVLTGEEDVVSYWDLLVRLWRYNLTVVVADGVKAVEEAISRSWIQVARQTCLVHLKRSRRVRDALDSSPLPSPSPPGAFPPLLPLCPQGGPSSNNPTSPSTPSRRVRQVPLPLEDRPGHGPQLQPLHLLSHSCNITRTLISS